MSSDELVFMTATQMVGRICQRELSAREVMQAHLKQIGRMLPISQGVLRTFHPGRP